MRRVDKEKNRMKVAEVLNDAVRLAELNQLDSARETLDCALKEVRGSLSGADPALVPLIEDLNETRERFENKSKYSQGGYAFAKEKEVSHRRQRGMGKQSTYCNQVQMAQKVSNCTFRSTKHS